MPLHIRPFIDDDRAAAAALHRAVTWPVRSDAGWDWLARNPARDAAGPDEPIAWVAENGRGGQGFVGQFVQRFWSGDTPLAGLTGHSIIVPPDLRGAAPRLIRHLVDRPGAALHFTLNANRRAAPLYRRGPLKPWPQDTHGLKLSWIVDHPAWLSGRLARSLPGADGPGPERFLNARLARPRPLRLPDPIRPIEDLTDTGPVAAFWAQLRREGRFLADRSPQTLRWRLSDPDLTTRPLLLGLHQEGKLVGWTLAMLGKAGRMEPAVLDIIDLIALNDDPAVLQELTRALLANGRRMGAAKVRLQVVSPAMLKALGPLTRRARREGGWGHGYAAFDPRWDAVIRAGWSPTPYDGDFSFCLRPPPAAG